MRRGVALVVASALTWFAAEAAADPPATWAVAWRRTCRGTFDAGDTATEDARVTWCYAHFDARSGRYLGPQSEAERNARWEPSTATSPPPAVPVGYTLVGACDADSALVRRRGRFEVRLRGQARPALALNPGTVPTGCARSVDGTRLAVTTADGVTMHLRRDDRYVATARWTERGLSALSFADHGDTLIGWRRDLTLMTAWRVGAPVVARRLPLSNAPRSYDCQSLPSVIGWVQYATVHDVPPRAPRAEHGFVSVCDRADVYATDAAEFADFRSDDRRWARAVAQRYQVAGRPPRVWRAPWGDRVAAWMYEPHPHWSQNYGVEVRVVEHGGTLYRFEADELHSGPTGPIDPEYFPDAGYYIALDRGRLDGLLRAMFDPPGSRINAARARPSADAGRHPRGRRSL